MSQSVRYLLWVVGLVFVGYYSLNAYLRQTGEVIYKQESPNKQYLAEIVDVRPAVFTGSRTYFVRILDASGSIVVTSFKTNSEMGAIRWNCMAKGCDGFMWSVQDGYYIELPPTWLERLHAKLP